jgi:hypothetical protein
MALTGMAQVAARKWAALDTSVGRAEAARLVGQLAWRGLGGFPKAAPSVASVEAPDLGEHPTPA